MKTDFLVLGGGITGLSLAEALCAHGRSVCVVERKPEWGGLLRSVDFCQHRFDLGPHAIYPQEEKDRAWFSDHLDGGMTPRDRCSFTLFRGRRVPYPLNLPATLGAVRWREAARVLVETGLGRWLRGAPPPGLSFESWALHCFGPTVYRLFLRQQTEKIWGRPCSQLSTAWVSAHLPANSLLQLLFSQLRESRLPIGFARRFYYGDHGCGQLTEHLRQTLEKQPGATLLARTKLVRARRQDGAWSALLRTAEGERRWSARRLVSTIPVRNLLEALDPPPPEDILICANRLRFRALVLVLLVVRRSQVSSANWLYLPSAERLLCRISEPKNLIASMRARPDTSLVAEILCDPDDPVWRSADGEIIERAVDDLIALQLIARGEVRAATVVRLPDAYPVFELGFEDRLRRVVDYLTRQESIHLLGRTGAFLYLDQVGCVRQAFDFVKQHGGEQSAG